MSKWACVYEYDYMSMSIWVYEYMSIWVYEYMSAWVFEYEDMSMSISVWVYEYACISMHIWVRLSECEYMSILHICMWVRVNQRNV